MINTVYSVPQIAERLAPIFMKYDVKKALLFGSYASGQADENSDVDLCVDSGLRGLEFMVLVDAIHEALEKKVDMLDVTHIKRQSKIDLEISETGVSIYEKQDHHPENNRIR